MLQQPAPAAPFWHIRDKQMEALEQLTEISNEKSSTRCCRHQRSWQHQRAKTPFPTTYGLGRRNPAAQIQGRPRLWLSVWPPWVPTITLGQITLAAQLQGWVHPRTTCHISSCQIYHHQGRWHYVVTRTHFCCRIHQCTPVNSPSWLSTHTLFLPHTTHTQSPTPHIIPRTSKGICCDTAGIRNLHRFEQGMQVRLCSLIRRRQMRWLIPSPGRYRNSSTWSGDQPNPSGRSTLPMNLAASHKELGVTLPHRHHILHTQIWSLLSDQQSYLSTIRVQYSPQKRGDPSHTPYHWRESIGILRQPHNAYRNGDNWIFKFNSVVSTPTSKWLISDIKKFYLNNMLPYPEYIKIHISDILKYIIIE